MSSLTDTAASVGKAVGDTAKKVGDVVVDSAEKAVDFVKDKTGLGTCSTNKDAGVAGIKEHMDVIASCGKKVGTVDHLDGASIKLTKSGSPDGQHHFIPTGWVDHVDSHVHLKKNSMETESGWKADAASCGCS